MSYRFPRVLTRPIGSSLSRWALVLALAGVVWACGDGSGRPPPVDSQTGGRDGSGGEGGDGPTGSGGGEVDEPGAPHVQVLAPEADAVLTETLEAGCGVTSDDAPGAGAVNPDSVVVRLLDEDGDAVVEGPATIGAADEYVAEFALETVPSGRYTVSCSASDDASPPLSDTAEVDVLVDHGPSIEPVSPLPGSFLSRAGLHDFEVKIRPVPLFEGDDDAALDGDPVISIDHQEFTLTPKGDEDPDVYIVYGIDFESDELFPDPPPDMTGVRVTAQNQRSVPGVLEYDVAVDGTGPGISIVSPPAATIIGTRVTFVFQIDDDFSGVDWDSLVAEVKDVPIQYDAASSRWTQTGNVATLELTTTDYSVATQLSINVTVADLAGNLSSNGAASTYFLDQQTPILSLDPENVRVVRGGDECSHSFDPVGDQAINHGENSYNLVQFRAFAWDRTNEELGQTIFHYSTVDTTSMRLWVSRAGEPLVVDTPLPGQSTGDGICDAISSAADADVDAVELSSIGTAGAPFFGDGTDDLSTPAMDGICGYAASPTPAPEPLCLGAELTLTYAVGQNLGGTAIPAVYAPLVGSGVGCAGMQQSIGALLGMYDGWVCAAVTGGDRAGNTTVSAPIAFCLDNPDTVASPDCWGDGADAAPDCTDTCVPLTTDVLATGAASSWPLVELN